VARFIRTRRALVMAIRGPRGDGAPILAGDDFVDHWTREVVLELARETAARTRHEEQIRGALYPAGVCGRSDVHF